MQKIETQSPYESFAVEDTSELIAVYQLVGELEGMEGTRARVGAMLSSVIADEMVPEQEPFTGPDADFILNSMRRVVNSSSPAVSNLPALREMVYEYEDSARRAQVLAHQRQIENGLILAGEAPVFEKLKSARAWRAISANYDTADQPALTPDLEKYQYANLRNIVIGGSSVETTE